MDKYSKDMVWASGTFLTDDLPENFRSMENEDLKDFIEGHLWQPFEGETAEDVLEMITTLADSMRGYIDNEKN